MLQGVCGWVQHGCDGIGGQRRGGGLHVQEDSDVMAAIVLQQFEVK